jgi:hypothetical protein
MAALDLPDVGAVKASDGSQSLLRPTALLTQRRNCRSEGALSLLPAPRFVHARTLRNLLIRVDRIQVTILARIRRHFERGTMDERIWPLVKAAVVLFAVLLPIILLLGHFSRSSDNSPYKEYCQSQWDNRGSDPLNTWSSQADFMKACEANQQYDDQHLLSR